jgi:peroxiredoxin Q/BCP
MSGLDVGNRVPDITLHTQTGEKIALADYRGKQPVVLFFYPKDGTPICTQEACSFRDAYEDFTAAGAAVIGISGDSASRHQTFAAEHRLPFLLVDDGDGSVRRAFGVPKTMGFLPGRVTYVIDKEGVIRHRFISQLNVEQHVAEALRVVRGLE